MPFQVIEHTGSRILEFVYPAHPTADDVREYVALVRRAVDRQKGAWSCLVDQRALVLMAPELVEEVKALNAYALKRGMKRTARVVASALGTLQAARFAREANLGVQLRAFTSRDEALAWLLVP